MSPAMREVNVIAIAVETAATAAIPTANASQSTQSRNRPNRRTPRDKKVLTVRIGSTTISAGPRGTRHFITSASSPATNTTQNTIVRGMTATKATAKGNASAGAATPIDIATGSCLASCWAALDGAVPESILPACDA